MTEHKGPIEFKDAAQVKKVMDSMAERFSGSDSIAGVGLLASFASAIATLAKEVDALKKQGRIGDES